MRKYLSFLLILNFSLLSDPLCYGSGTLKSDFTQKSGESPQQGFTVGFNIDAHSILQNDHEDQTIRDLLEAHIRLVRIEYNGFNFDGSFSTEGEQYIRARYKEFINKLNHHGIKTILLLASMSFQSDGGERPPHYYNSTQMNYFINALIGSDRAIIPDFYAESGGGVRIFEIWNEPNWTWRVDESELARVFQIIYTYTKSNYREDPVSILAGAFDSGKGDNTGGNHENVRSYLYNFYNSNSRYYRLNNHWPFDGISLHPYGWFRVPGDGLVEHVNKVYLDTMKYFGDSTTPLWITEIGSIASADDGHVEQISEILNIIKENKIALRIRSLVYFTLRYFNAQDVKYHYGFVREDGFRRSSYDLIQEFLKPKTSPVDKTKDKFLE